MTADMPSCCFFDYYLSNQAKSNKLLSVVSYVIVYFLFIHLFQICPLFFSRFGGHLYPLCSFDSPSPHERAHVPVAGNHPPALSDHSYTPRQTRAGSPSPRGGQPNAAPDQNPRGVSNRIRERGPHSLSTSHK